MKAIPTPGLNQFKPLRMTLRNKALRAAAKYTLGVLLAYLGGVIFLFIYFGISEVAFG